MPPSVNVEDLPLNSFHKRLAVYSAGGPFLDGYVLSIIGVALVQATPQLELTVYWEGLIGASALVGIFFGGFLGGWLTDKFGRQTLYTLDLAAIVLCSALQFWVQDALGLFVLRLLIGIAVGADYPIATSLLVEFTPRRYRGPLVGSLIVMWFVGAAVAYIVGELLLQTGPDGWRWMLASATFPALVFLILRHGTPESPRWLANKGRMEEARAVVTRVFGEGVKLASFESAAGDRVSAGVLFRSGYGGRIFFISVFWTCSIIPLFAIYAFAPRILDALGLGGTRANFGSAAITVLFLLGTVVFVLLINRLGRRKVILHSFLWSGLALLGLGLFPQSSPTVTMILFAGYALFIGGTQILQWVYPNELFPTEVRGTAVGLASSLSRIGAAAGTYLVPLSLTELGIGATMLIAAGITLVGFLVSLRMAPETRGLALEEAASL
ncbi:MFS transporter [Pseudarthrobacter sp. Y6]|uniref:MFS transporter n=1 Tax=Pseudarthrobacter sp. Y6 TaxID=3418422 RepID=UPI003CEA585B